MTLVQYDRDADGVVTLVLNDPGTRNAISGLPMIEALLARIAEAEADPRARVIVLTGTAPAFSSGGNLKAMAEGQGLVDALPAQTRRNYRDGIQRLPLAFEAMELPVIAAVNGPAIGAGCDLALMCDIRIAGQSAKFAESFVRIGIVPGDGGAWLLPRVVGFAKASEMALTGDMVDADEALRSGPGMRLATLNWPPISLLLSNRVTSWPRSAATVAAAKPAGPAPTTAIFFTLVVGM